MALTAFCNLTYNVYHFKIYIYHLLCRYLNEIVLFNTWLLLIISVSSSTVLFIQKHQSTFQRGKYSCFLAADLETKIQRNSVTYQGHQTRWAQADKGAPGPPQTLVHSLVHSPKHWFTVWFTLLSVLPLHPSMGLGKNSPYKINLPGLCILEGLKLLKFAQIDKFSTSAVTLNTNRKKSAVISTVHQVALCSLHSRKGLSIKLCITERNSLFCLCLLNSLYLLFVLEAVKIQGCYYKHSHIGSSACTVLNSDQNIHPSKLIFLVPPQLPLAPEKLTCWQGHHELVAFVAETKRNYCNIVCLIRSSV